MKKAVSFLALAFLGAIAFAFGDTEILNTIGNAFSSEGLTLGITTVALANPQLRTQLKQVKATTQTKVAEAAIATLDSAPAIDDFTITIANAHAADTETAVLWNASSLVTGISSGADITISTSQGATYTNLLAVLRNGNFCISGFTYIVENQSQYNLAFVEYTSNGSGDQVSKARNSLISKITAVGQYQNQLGFNIPFYRKMTQYVAWTLAVNPSSTVTLVFTVIPESQMQY